MSCPTCDSSMQSGGCNGVWWCSRCGTLVIGGLSIKTVNRPNLVDRLRTIEKEPDGEIGEDWIKLEITECINLPQDRIK